MSLEESFSRLEAAIDLLIERTRGTDDGFRKGLTHGLLLALLMLHERAGQPQAPPLDPPRRGKPRPKPPPTDQLDLFNP